MPEDNTSIAIVFLIYLAAMLGLGIIFFRRTESTADYFLGDRKLGQVGAALSAQASDMSGWLLLGLPGRPTSRPLGPPGLPSGSSRAPI